MGVQIDEARDHEVALRLEHAAVEAHPRSSGGAAAVRTPEGVEAPASK